MLLSQRNVLNTCRDTWMVLSLAALALALALAHKLSAFDPNT